MKRFTSILCATLVTLTLCFNAFAGNIHGIARDGNIHGIYGNIHGVYGAVVAVVTMVI
jgi:hypothetical protein